MNTNLETDNLLLQLISQGDNIAYTTIFRKYYKALVIFAHTFLKNKETAEDLVQNFFCKIWEERINLSKIENCRSYFYISIHHTCLNYLRDNKIITGNPLPEKPAEENMLDILMEEEIYRILIENIRQLPGKCKDILLMKINGMGNTEIAAQMNITEETVRSQIRRGKNLLKTHMQLTAALLIALHLLS